MRFEEAYEGWSEGRLTQTAAAQILGMCERSFRRYLSRYEAEGLEGLLDRRLEHVSYRKAPVDEVMALTERYRSRRLRCAPRFSALGTSFASCRRFFTQV